MSFSISDKFHLYHKDKISEKKTKVFFYEHKKTKAKIIFYDCDNENATFAINFKTPVNNSKGVTHILEHMVFEGSRKYQEKANFDYLLNNSLATFINAYTWQDKTSYIFASSFKKDYLNLLDIYLDFTFFPLLDENTFKREGFFYSKEAGSFQFNGIVFNEMKNSLLGYDRKNYFEGMKELFPGSTYSHLQGGDPVEIVDLNIEDVRDYHKNFYHPSNSYTILYGKIDKKKVFSKLDEYFSEFDFKNLEVENNLTVINEPKRVEDFYQDYNNDGKVSYSKSIVFDKVSAEEEIALGFLIDLLFKYEFSPMKRALEDSGLINGIYGAEIDNENGTPYFKLELRSLEEKNITKIIEIFEINLKKLSKKIDKEIKETVYKKLQFRTKEFNFYQNQGVDYFLGSISRFINGENPVEVFKTIKILKIINKYTKGKRLESLIKKHFLNNKRILDHILKPNPTLLDDYKKVLDTKLSQKLKLIDLKKLEKEIDELEKWKEIPKRDHTYKNQKKIGIKDLDVAILKYNNKYQDNIFQTILPTEDIVRLELVFDVSKIGLEKLEYFSIYLYVINYISTKNYNFDKFTMLKSKFLSSINFDIKTFEEYENDKGYLTLSISTRYLKSDYEQVLNIFDEFINHIKFTEKERMKYLVSEFYEVSKNKLDRGFSSYSKIFLGKYTNKFGYVFEGIEGMSLIKKLQNISNNFNHEFDNLVLELENIHKFIFSSNLILNIGTSEKFAAANFSDAKKLAKKFNLNLVNRDDFVPFTNPNFKNIFEDKNFYLKVNSDTNFNFLLARFEKFPKEVRNFLPYVGDYLSQYVNEKIRFNRGAYGAGARLSTSSSSLMFSSWSDPLINESFKTFLNSKNNYEVGKFVKTKFEKLKKQNISSYKKLYKNSEIFDKSFYTFMSRRTDSDREQTLHDVKSISFVEFKKLFNLIKKPSFIIKLVCTNDNNIKKFKEKYTEIKPL